MTTPSLPESRWQAVLARDARHDGQFWFAVRSTGIYCRPSCPARRPKPEHVAFFEDPGAAEAAGFRPCRRCHPREVSARQRAVARAQHRLDTAEVFPSLADLAAEVGLSPAHLQRVFKAALGVSPKQYALARRGERLRAALRAGEAVTTAQYGAGHGSSRSLYDPALDTLGMTPGAYRRGGAGERVMYAFTEGALGPMLVAGTARGLCAVRFGERAALLEDLRAEYPRAQLIQDDAALAEQVRAVRAHLEGRAPGAALPTDVPGTDFQRRVWAALREIPAGETRSYAQVARMIGAPAAVRAVAQACAANPVALVVPCHRVVRADGALSGYRWGVERKRALLERERQANGG